jgi:hypothetical protein
MSFDSARDVPLMQLSGDVHNSLFETRPPSLLQCVHQFCFVPVFESHSTILQNEQRCHFQTITAAFSSIPIPAHHEQSLVYPRVLLTVSEFFRRIRNHVQVGNDFPQFADLLFSQFVSSNQSSIGQFSQFIRPLYRLRIDRHVPNTLQRDERH